MKSPASSSSLPEVMFGGPDGAYTLWDYRAGVDVEYGMLAWRGQRCWFAFSSYDETEEVVRYSVFTLTEEEARVLDDWHAHYLFLSHQWRVLANDPITAHGLALKEKARQVEAFRAVRPDLESLPAIAQFSVSDYGLSGKPSK
jgi:hypothetical protein